MFANKLPSKIGRCSLCESNICKEQSISWFLKEWEIQTLPSDFIFFYQHEHFQLETHYFREISLQVTSWVGIHQVRKSTILEFDWEFGFKMDLC